jgi:hypothetical protein
MAQPCGCGTVALAVRASEGRSRPTRTDHLDHVRIGGGSVCYGRFCPSEGTRYRLKDVAKAGNKGVR